jgi:hypothetical protein
LSDGALQPAPDFLRRSVDDGEEPAARVELILDTHRVTGALEYNGEPRRLVDMIGNGSGEDAVVLSDASVESLVEPGEPQQLFQTLHVRREAILLAVPEWQTPASNDPIEKVQKRPAPATLVLPGLEVTGHVYLPEGASPTNVRLIGRSEFMPVTHAEVTHIPAGLYRCQKPLVAINLARLILYAPAGR